MANGMRQIMLLLIPAAVAILVLSEPMTRIVYERGEFDATQTELVSTALFWFAFSLPFNGIFLLLTRTFFSLQRPWLPTSISLLNLLVTGIDSYLLYKEFEVAGIVFATVLATAASVVAQVVLLRNQLGRPRPGPVSSPTGVRVVLASAALGAVAYGVWWALDDVLGRGLGGQIVSMGGALAVGGAVYAVAITLLRIPEASQLRRLLRR